MCGHVHSRLHYSFSHRQIMQACLKCGQQTIIDPDSTRARSYYPEHIGCGGLFIRELDSFTMSLETACTSVISAKLDPPNTP